jgi:hypothetical protein
MLIVRILIAAQVSRKLRLSHWYSAREPFLYCYLLRARDAVRVQRCCRFLRSFG